MKNTIRMEISIFFLTVLCQAAFLYTFLKKTEGIVQYADWREKDGILFYTTQSYGASKLLAAAFLLIVLIEASITFYGIWKKSWLAVPAAVAGMLLFVGMIVQNFYNAGARLERQIIFAALGFAAMCVYYLFVSVKLTDRQWAAVTAALCILIFVNFLLAVYGLLTGNTVNGSSGWVRLGSLSIQPGEFMKVLLILFSAFCYRARINKTLTIFYMGVSFGTVFVLVMSRDLGNAAILLLIWLISSWYLLGWKAALLIGVTSAGGAAAAVWKMSYVQERFRACFRALESGSGQQYNSLMAILKGGFSGIGPDGNTVAATAVTSSGTDLVFNVIFGIFGISAVIFLILLLLIQLAHLFLTPVISPFHYMLGVLGTVTFFFQYVLHIGGCLNVLPLTGICAPFLSYGGSNLICSFLILGGILASFSPQFERRRFKIKAKEEKEYGTENMEEEDPFFDDGAVSWDDVGRGNRPFGKWWRKSRNSSRI